MHPKAWVGLSKPEPRGCSKSSLAALVRYIVTYGLYRWPEQWSRSRTTCSCLGRETIVWGLGLHPTYFKQAQKYLLTQDGFLFYSVFLYSFSSVFCVTHSLQESVETEMLLGKHLFLQTINGMRVAWHLIYERTQKGDANIFSPPTLPSCACFLALLAIVILHRFLCCPYLLS